MHFVQYAQLTVCTVYTVHTVTCVYCVYNKVTMYTQKLKTRQFLPQACFMLEHQETGDRETYGISLDSVKSVLEYKNNYLFSIPKTEVSFCLKFTGFWPFIGLFILDC